MFAILVAFREDTVTVFMIMRLKGDPDGFERYANEHGDLMQRIADAGRAAGGIRHAFAGGDGELLVIDEWPDPEAFQRFFDSQSEVIPQLIQEAGAEGPPQITFYRKLDTPDTF
jgi:hypothetical protein